MARIPYKWHTIAETFEQICNNHAPWVALGNFLNDWWFFAIEHRQEMIKEQPAPAPTPEMQRWSAFCAATVEWLCWQEGMPFPTWTSQQEYILAEPWYLYEKWTWRAWLLATTPAPFKMRNIYGGDRMFLHVPHRSLSQPEQEKEKPT